MKTATESKLSHLMESSSSAYRILKGEREMPLPRKLKSNKHLVSAFQEKNVPWGITRLIKFCGTAIGFNLTLNPQTQLQ